MNSLYNLALRQTTAIQTDLERMKGGEGSVSLQGQISASLAALHRTIEDYDSMAKRELIKAKQEKAFSRVQKFRIDYQDLRTQFDRTKTEATNARLASQRSELLGPESPTATRQRLQSHPQFQQSSTPESPFSLPPASSSPFGPSSGLREGHALREHSFIQNTENQLDSFIAQGREVLDNLVDQRNVLKGTQKRLLDAANTIGLSRDVIGWIERRSKEDTVIFCVGAVVTLFCFWLIWHYLG